MIFHENSDSIVTLLTEFQEMISGSRMWKNLVAWDATGYKYHQEIGGNEFYQSNQLSSVPAQFGHLFLLACFVDPSLSLGRSILAWGRNFRCVSCVFLGPVSCLVSE